MAAWFYQECECLWNIKSNIYKRLNLKQKCYEELNKELKLTVDEIKKKINKKFTRNLHIWKEKSPKINTTTKFGMAESQQII